MGLPDQRQPCRKVTADWMSHTWWHLESCLLCTGYDGALGKAQVLAEGYFGKKTPLIATLSRVLNQKEVE